MVPQSDYALALKVSQGFGDSGDMNTARKFLGVTDTEIDNLCEKVLEAVSTGPLDPSALKVVLGDAVRSFGAEGKKRGQTTSLPIALGRLQSSGEIRREPVNGRLDQQRYSYVRWPENPLRGFKLSTEEAFVELAQRYFSWIGPATPANFQWFSGLGVKAAKAALEPLNLVPIEDGSDWLIHQDDVNAFRAFERPKEPEYSLLSSIDAILLHRRDLKSLLDPSDLDRQMAGDQKVYELGSVQDLASNAILDRGRVIGLWEYEPSSESIAWTSFVDKTDGLKKEVAKMEEFICSQLGDARSFSLDSPESRQGRIDSLRA